MCVFMRDRQPETETERQRKNCKNTLVSFILKSETSYTVISLGAIFIHLILATFLLLITVCFCQSNDLNWD